MKFSILKLFTIVHITTVLILTSLITYWQHSLIQELHNTQIKSFFEQIHRTTKIFFNQEIDLIKNTVQNNNNNNNNMNIDNIDFNNIDFIATVEKDTNINVHGYNLSLNEKTMEKIIKKITMHDPIDNQHIYNILIEDESYFMILYKEHIVDKNFGKIIGNIYGIELLNKNLSLMNSLKNKLNILDIHLVHNNKVIASSNKKSLYKNEMKIDKVYELANNENLHMKKTFSEDLDIIYIIDNKAYSASLQRQYDKLIKLLYLFVVFGFIVYIFIQYKILSKLDSLRKFIKSTIENKNERIDYQNSNVKEIDDTADDFYRLFNIYDKREKLLFQQSKLASMGEMIANIAHQWRQPLSTITLSAGLINQMSQKDIKDKKLIQETTNDIEISIDYLTNTINTFIDFAKDEKNHQAIPIQLEIRQAKEITGTLLNYHNIQIKDNINYENKNIIYIRKGEVAQVIINILNNAKDIILERKINAPWIKLDLIASNDGLLLTIEDNAGGIKEEIMDKIFDPYFTTKHQSQGTGLGLYMSYKIIIESLNGKLWVENTENGAKFYILIPYK